MFFRKDESLERAKKLIQAGSLEEHLDFFKKKGGSIKAPPSEILKWVLAMSACNLVRTMKVEFIAAKIPAEDQQDVIDDYVVESLRRQKLVKVKDGAEQMEMCQNILKATGELETFWLKGDDDPNSPGPRYYCVKEVLRRLGDEKNFDLHDALFEFMYLQYKQFLDYFRTFLQDPNLS